MCVCVRARVPLCVWLCVCVLFGGCVCSNMRVREEVGGELESEK